jgi:hypothetical protein
VWACAGNCGLVSAFDESIDIGHFGAGVTINAVVIDDDDDNRINGWVANGDTANPVAEVQNQSMVEYLSFDIPFEADWSYYAADSIGLVDKCVMPTAAMPDGRAALYKPQGIPGAYVPGHGDEIFLPMISN